MTWEQGSLVVFGENHDHAVKRVIEHTGLPGDTPFVVTRVDEGAKGVSVLN